MIKDINRLGRKLKELAGDPNSLKGEIDHLLGIAGDENTPRIDELEEIGAQFSRLSVALENLADYIGKNYDV